MTEITRFVPPALATLQDPPVFLLRQPKPRETRELSYDLLCAGLRFHDLAEIRAEALRGLDQLWSPDAVAAGKERLTGFWARIDAGETLEPAEASALADLSTRLADAWPPLNRMAADNRRFVTDAPLLAAARLIAGWQGVDVGYSREANRVPLERLDRLQEALAKLDGGEVGFAELAGECLHRINAPAPADETGTGTATSHNPPRRRRRGKLPKGASK